MTYVNPCCSGRSGSIRCDSSAESSERTGTPYARGGRIAARPFRPERARASAPRALVLAPFRARGIWNMPHSGCGPLDRLSRAFLFATASSPLGGPRSWRFCLQPCPRPERLHGGVTDASLRAAGAPHAPFRRGRAACRTSRFALKINTDDR